MTELIHQISDAMEKAGWTHVCDYEKNIIMFVATNKLASLRLSFIFSSNNPTYLTLYILFERRCCEEFKSIISDFLSRINFAIPIGFFLFDINDGEIRFRQSLDISSLEITPKFINNFINSSVSIFRKFYLPIHSILSGTDIREVCEKYGI